MKKIKALLLLSLLFVSLITVIGFTLPATTHVERSITIDAFPATVFSEVNSLKKIHDWLSLSEVTPLMDVTFSGPETGLGAAMRWSSDKAGIGTQEIVLSVPYERVETRLSDHKGPAFTFFQLRPSAEQTLVTWGYSSDHGFNIFDRYMGLMTREWVADDYEKGLAALKDRIESQPRIYTQEIQYSVQGTPLVGYIAYPRDRESLPGILVIHEWWGHNDYARERAEMLAHLGYVAFALDMYGDGKVAEHPQQANEFMMDVINNAEVGQLRFEAALEILQNLSMTDPTKTAAIGYCFGGSIALSMARAGANLDGVVSFHGGLEGLAPIAEDEVQADFLVLNGGDDPMVTAQQKRHFKREMNAAGVNYEFIDYPGALHSFTNPRADKVAEQYNLPLQCDADADADSWRRMKAFLQQIF